MPMTGIHTFLYCYCKEHDIELYMKYNTMHKEQEKVTDKNRFRSYRMKPDEEDNIYCPHPLIKLNGEKIDE